MLALKRAFWMCAGVALASAGSLWSSFVLYDRPTDRPTRQRHRHDDGGVRCCGRDATFTSCPHRRPSSTLQTSICQRRRPSWV